MYTARLCYRANVTSSPPFTCTAAAIYASAALGLPVDDKPSPVTHAWPRSIAPSWLPAGPLLALDAPTAEDRVLGELLSRLGRLLPTGRLKLARTTESPPSSWCRSLFFYSCPKHYRGRQKWGREEGAHSGIQVKAVYLCF